MRYIKGLDTLRAFTVIAVLIGHWGLPIELGSTGDLIFKGLFPSPKFGVDLFFVLSGFLITSILLDATNDQENKLVIIRTFIARRTLRIFPIYYITFGVLLLIKYPYIKDHLVWFLTYTSNILCYREKSWNSFSHTWSLSVEEQFYFIWPLLIVFINPRFLKYIFYLSILIGIAATLYVRAEVPPNYFALLLMPACMQAFGIGGLYAYISRMDDQKKIFLKGINILFPVALLFHFYWGFSADGGHFNYWYRTVDSILSIWLIHYTIVIRPGWVKNNILENRFLIRVGQISYGIYLYHYALPWVYQMVVNKMGGENSPVGAFLLNHYVSYFARLILLFALSLASFEFIEKPILKLKRFFEYKTDKSSSKSPDKDIQEATGLPLKSSGIYS
ncbi:MAG TPA: acyltransferase [Puia sp.]